MVEALTRQTNSFSNNFDSWSAPFHKIEISDDRKRAIITIPLMHVGANKKGLYWTAQMLKEIAPMFRGVTYRYDVGGQEGSSHATNKLSSPHFDIGWTYSDERGAWYCTEDKTLWVQGEVTHPDVLRKLERETTDGKREVNFASMGVMVDEAKCSVCGADWIHETNECDNGHVRLKEEEGSICYKVPTSCSKALHVALTNDPADGEAEIANCVFQELNAIDRFQSKKPTPGDYQMVPTEVKDVQGGKFNTTNDFKNNTNSSNMQNDTNSFKTNYAPKDDTNSSGHEMKNSVNQPVNQATTNGQFDQQGSPTNTMPNGMTGEVGNQFLGPTPSPETILKDLAERIKTIETRFTELNNPTETPEVVNSAPQDQFTQDNMGVTNQFQNKDAIGRDTIDKKQDEVGKMDIKDAQYSNEKAPVNPKPEVQETMGDPMSQIVQMLQEILNRLPGAEMQDMGKEAQSANKGMMKNDETGPTDHQAPGDSAGSTMDEGAKKNKEYMNKPGMVATADDAKEEKPAETTEEETKEAPKEDLKEEVADLKTQMKHMRSMMEAADNTIPEFGSNSNPTKGIEAADMNAKGRADTYGDFGKWDSIFNGSNSASRFAGGK